MQIVATKFIPMCTIPIDHLSSSFDKLPCPRRSNLQMYLYLVASYKMVQHTSECLRGGGEAYILILIRRLERGH